MGQETCKTCPAGYYCSDTDINKCQPQNVEVSFYCDGSVKTKIMCPAGTYNLIDGTNSASDCKKCTAGYYCPN